MKSFLFVSINLDKNNSMKFTCSCREVFLLLFLVAALENLFSYGHFGFLQGFAGGCIVLDSSYRYLRHSTTYTTYPSYIFLLLFCIVFGSCFSVATTMHSHEYFYFFGGDMTQRLHQEFDGAKFCLLLAVLIITATTFLHAGKTQHRVYQVLFGGVFLYLLTLVPPLYSVQETREALVELSRLPATEWLFGFGEPWREELASRLSLELHERVKEIGLPSLLIILFRGGLFFLFPVLVLICLCFGLRGSLFLFLPGLHYPLSILGFFIAYLFFQDLEKIREKSNSPSLITYFGIALFTVSICFVLYCVILFATVDPRIARKEPAESFPSEFLDELVIAEDVLFFAHHGVDFARLKWVVRDVLQTRTLSKGASTISMQLAKMLYLSYEPTLLRKAKQVVLGTLLEFVYSKQEILEWYMQTVDFANGAIGFHAASQHYFKKPFENLNQEERETLLLSVPNPYAFNPSMNTQTRSIRIRRRALRGNIERFHDAISQQRAGALYVATN